MLGRYVCVVLQFLVRPAVFPAIEPVDDITYKLTDLFM